MNSISDSTFTHPFFYPAVKLLARSLARNPSSRQILSLPVHEQKLYISRILRPLPSQKNSATDPDVIYQTQTGLGFVKKFNQLPCTTESRKRRADLLEMDGLKDKNILLLGDDDLVSVELATRGFTKLTVADYDKKLLTKIQTLTKSCHTSPALIHANFFKEFKTIERADAVVLDPPYNPEFAEHFLNCSLQSTTQQPGCRIYLNINTYCMGSEAMNSIFKKLEDSGYVLDAHVEGFNQYEVSRWLLPFLRILYLAFDEKLVWEKNMIPHMCSDLYSFRKI